MYVCSTGRKEGKTVISLTHSLAPLSLSPTFHFFSFFPFAVCVSFVRACRVIREKDKLKKRPALFACLSVRPWYGRSVAFVSSDTLIPICIDIARMSLFQITFIPPPPYFHQSVDVCPSFRASERAQSREGRLHAHTQIRGIHSSCTLPSSEIRSAARNTQHQPSGRVRARTVSENRQTRRISARRWGGGEGGEGAVGDCPADKIVSPGKRERGVGDSKYILDPPGCDWTSS